ncbi:STAS domain-containing protein [Trinickia sp. NRRL B-1857]|uniref:STAS domain-containing protein n=1 Tax=Trinickia sp. NRRL B-1857 TaxID=3162879 RepID=UPI003D2C0B7C
MNSAHTVSIDTPLTIYHAAELKALLLDALAHPQSLCVDLSAVPEIDSAGAQLLVAMRRSASDLGRACEFVGASDTVLATLTLLGLAQTLARLEQSNETLSAHTEAIS